jgi:hypothetical protein
MDHYMNDIRKKILSFKNNSKVFIKNTNEWHFQKDVYNEQVLNKGKNDYEKKIQNENTDIYNNVLINSTFSLCPVGAGPNTIRLWESLGYGSIPILIGNDYLLPFPDIPHIYLDYKSHHLTNEETLNKYLENILKNINLVDYQKRCLEITEYIKIYGFIYNVQLFNEIVKTKIVLVKEREKKLNIIIQTYPEKNIDRLNELILCIVSNLQNTNVKKVINLCEGSDDNYLPDVIRKHSKYVCKNGYERLTYKTAFDYSNEHLNGEMVGLINTDIMLADDFRIDDLHKILTDKVVIANARHEIDLSNGGKTFLDENFKQIFHANTQDAWFYKIPIQVENTDFELGLVGCDNAIAHRFQSSGYIIYNMPERFKIIHVDSLRGKNSKNFSEFHKENEAKKQIKNKHPENEGQLLVPNYDAVKQMSFDKFLQMLGFTEEEKVWLMTRAMSEKMKIKN